MAAGDFRIGLNETQAGLVAHEGIQRLLRRLSALTTRRGCWWQARSSTPRAAVIAALQPEHIDLERFVQAWMEPGTQSALHALVARLKT